MIEVYLSLNGNAQEAADYYAKVFDGKVAYVMKFNQLPPEEMKNMPKGADDLVMYANVKTYGGDIMLSDMMPGQKVKPNEGVWITFSDKNPDKLRKAFDRLAKDGKVVMPLEKTFFSELYGQVVDKFGFYWMLMIPSAMEG